MLSKHIKSKIKNGLVSTILLMTSTSANALFYIDNEGLEEDAKKIAEQKLKQQKPDGFRVLTDKRRGVVHELGTGKAFKDNSFGTDLALKDAISMIMPNKWIAYIDESIKQPDKVSWSAKRQTWTNTLIDLGINHGYRFIVDWDQKLLQIEKDKDYIKPDFNYPVEIVNPENGRRIYIYTADPEDKKGVLLIGTKSIPLKVTK